MFLKQKRLGTLKALKSSKRDNARFGYTDSFSEIFGNHNQIAAFATSGGGGGGGGRGDGGMGWGWGG